MRIGVAAASAQKFALSEPTADTLNWFQSVVQGHFQYHAIPGNWQRLQEFRKPALALASLSASPK